MFLTLTKISIFQSPHRQFMEMPTGFREDKQMVDWDGHACILDDLYSPVLTVPMNFDDY